MESKPYLDWQWEGRPAEGEVVQCVFDDITLVGYWIEEDAGDREHDEHLISVWYVLSQRNGEVTYMDGVPICWKPLDPPPPIEFGWEVCINTAVYHNGEFKHNCPTYYTVIAPTAEAAEKLVEVPADKEYTISDRLTVKTASFIHGGRFLGRKVERLVVEFIRDGVD
jgi:hypothetical protein